MELITYDKEKCDGCGFCAAVCICDVQLQKEKKEIPEVIHPENCVVCGHCVAVCPSDAIIHHKIDMNNMVPINHAEIDGDNMENFLSSKRSVRHFSNKPVSRDVIEKLIKVAHDAGVKVLCGVAGVWTLMGEGKLAPRRYPWII